MEFSPPAPSEEALQEPQIIVRDPQANEVDRFLVSLHLLTLEKKLKQFLIADRKQVLTLFKLARRDSLTELQNKTKKIIELLQNLFGSFDMSAQKISRGPDAMNKSNVKQTITHWKKALTDFLRRLNSPLTKTQNDFLTNHSLEIRNQINNVIVNLEETLTIIGKVVEGHDQKGGELMKLDTLMQRLQEDKEKISSNKMTPMKRVAILKEMIDLAMANNVNQADAIAHIKSGLGYRDLEIETHLKLFDLPDDIQGKMEDTLLSFSAINFIVDEIAKKHSKKILEEVVNGLRNRDNLLFASTLKYMLKNVLAGKVDGLPNNSLSKSKTGDGAEVDSEKAQKKLPPYALVETDCQVKRTFKGRKTECFGLANEDLCTIPNDYEHSDIYEELFELKVGEDEILVRLIERKGRCYAKVKIRDIKLIANSDLEEDEDIEDTEDGEDVSAGEIQDDMEFDAA